LTSPNAVWDFKRVGPMSRPPNGSPLESPESNQSGERGTNFWGTTRARTSAICGRQRLAHVRWIGLPAGTADDRWDMDKLPRLFPLSRLHGEQLCERRLSVYEEQCTVKKDGLKGASEEVEALKSFIKVPQSTDLFLKTPSFFILFYF